MTSAALPSLATTRTAILPWSPASKGSDVQPWSSSTSSCQRATQCLSELFPGVGDREECLGHPKYGPSIVVIEEPSLDPCTTKRGNFTGGCVERVEPETLTRNPSSPV